jgi:hypothetical protein
LGQSCCAAGNFIKLMQRLRNRTMFSGMGELSMQSTYVLLTGVHELCPFAPIFSGDQECTEFAGEEPRSLNRLVPALHFLLISLL